jgi:hypothetical protein
VEERDCDWNDPARWKGDTSPNLPVKNSEAARLQVSNSLNPYFNQFHLVVEKI